MTPEQFFEQYPNASKVWQVGDDLFFEAYQKSASAFAERVGIPLTLLTREQVEGAAKKVKPATEK